MHYPTKLCIMEYNKIAIEAGLETLSKIGIASLVAVGTKEGKVLKALKNRTMKFK